MPAAASITGEVPSQQSVPPEGSRWVVVAICSLLCLIVVLVFCQAGGYDFVNFDDDRYVYDNDHLKHGFTWDGLIYYVYHWHSYTYHPLSTYSHMLDCQLFGLEAGGHHWTNLVLHAITAALLFLLLRRMTGRLWPTCPGGCPLCHPPAAGRIGGLDLGAERRAQRTVLRLDAGGLRAFRRVRRRPADM